MYLRSFKKGKKRYYYIAKAIRKGAKVIQKSILYLGTADTIYDMVAKLKKKA